MVEFLTTADVSAKLQKLIRESNEYIVLISPYLRTNTRVRELLEQKSDGDTHVRIIYGKKELQSEEQQWVDSVPGIELFFRQSLHAKCYVSENEAILTSMNLYAYSEQNNDEMGIIVSKHRESDRELYERIFEEAEHIASLSQKVREVPRGSDKSSIPTTGFCIRGGETISANPLVPYCDRHYKIWKRFQNDDFQEKYCHICREESPTSRRKPLCWDCYQKYKSAFTFLDDKD